ncbi:MAG TPA: dodecin family protein [Anseongella sp.]
MAVLKVVELLSDSATSWDDAVKIGVSRASKTLKNVRSAYVKDHSVTVENGQITAYRVVLKITFEVE